MRSATGREMRRRRRRRRSEGDNTTAGSETTTDDEGEYDGEGFNVCEEPEGKFDVAFVERFAASLPNEAAATTTTAAGAAGEKLFHGENADEDAGYSSAPEYSDYGGNEGSPTSLQGTSAFGGNGAAAGAAAAAGTRPVQLSVTQRLVKRPRLLVRKIVTGDEGKRVRDFVQDWVRMPKVVRTRDKASFVFGVLGLCLTEAIAICRMEQFWAWYTFMMLYLISLRAYLYSKMNMHYFLIDFCYFTCVSCMVAIYVATPDSVNTFQTAFAIANGPVLGALIVWRNSLVFHSIDKITTVYIHCLPSLLMWCWRWYGLAPIRSLDDIVEFDRAKHQANQRAVAEMRLANWMGLPLAAYAVWQALYLLKTEYWDRVKLDSNPDIKTSLRWIVNNEKMASHRVSLYVMRKMGFMGPQERFDPSSLKTKTVMVTGQFVFTLVTLLPVKLMYDHFWFHSVVILYAYINCVWNGASYYFDVFTRDYAKSVEERAAKRGRSSRRAVRVGNK